MEGDTSRATVGASKAARDATAEEVRWLSPQELNAWIALGRVIMRLPAALDSHLERQADLSFFEYLVLAMLSEQPDRTLRMSQLAETTSSSLSRLSHTAARLELEGFITRRRCEGVGRSTAATLTQKGYRKLVRSAPGHVESARSLVIDALTKEQLRSLAAIATCIVERLDVDAMTRTWD